MVLLSDDLDEIDREVAGTWNYQNESNYFGKAYIDYGVTEFVPVDDPPMPLIGGRQILSGLSMALVPYLDTMRSWCMNISLPPLSTT